MNDERTGGVILTDKLYSLWARGSNCQYNFLGGGLARNVYRVVTPISMGML